MTPQVDMSALVARLAVIVKERDALRDALEELLDACPTSCEDKRLIDAQKKAERLLKMTKHGLFCASFGVYLCECGEYCQTKTAYDKHMAAVEEEEQAAKRFEQMEEEYHDSRANTR